MLKARRVQDTMEHIGEAMNILAETERMEEVLQAKSRKGCFIKREWILQMPKGKTTVREVNAAQT